MTATIRPSARLPSALAVAALLAAGCAGSARPAAAGARRDVQAEVARLLDAWHAAATRADARAYFDALSERAVFLGTDATERWDKRAFWRYARPYFARGKAWRFWAVRRSISVSPDGRVVWFDEDLGTENLGPARGSGVLVREGGRWRIVQYNLSIPIPNDRFEAVKKLIAR